MPVPPPCWPLFGVRGSRSSSLWRCSPFGGWVPGLGGLVWCRPISTSRLASASRRFHLWPIDPLFWRGPLTPCGAWKPHLGAGFPLRCFQRLSFPNVANQPCTWRYNWHTRGSSIPVLSYWGRPSIKFPARAEDRDRTVSRRSEPSSRTALMGEQPNPWDLLQPQDATSRHRGAKPCRRYGLLGKISLLSPGYLLSVERPRTHVPWPDH